MSTQYNVAVLVGSLHKGAYNRMLARTLSELAPARLQLSVIEIGDRPLYDEDIEARTPAALKRFRERVQAVVRCCS